MTPALVCDATFKELTAKHPTPPLDHMPGRLASTTEPFQTSELEVRRLIRTFPAGSSGGPDGLRPSTSSSWLTRPSRDRRLSLQSRPSSTSSWRAPALRKFVPLSLLAPSWRSAKNQEACAQSWLGISGAGWLQNARMHSRLSRSQVICPRDNSVLEWREGRRRQCTRCAVSCRQRRRKWS